MLERRVCCFQFFPGFSQGRFHLLKELKERNLLPLAVSVLGRVETLDDFCQVRPGFRDMFASLQHILAAGRARQPGNEAGNLQKLAAEKIEALLGIRKRPLRFAELAERKRVFFGRKTLYRPGQLGIAGLAFLLDRVLDVFRLVPEESAESEEKYRKREEGYTLPAAAHAILSWRALTRNMQRSGNSLGAALLLPGKRSSWRLERLIGERFGFFWLGLFRRNVSYALRRPIRIRVHVSCVFFRV